MPDRKSIITAVMCAIEQNRIREAEVWLYTMSRRPVEDEIVFGVPGRVITWRKPLLASYRAPMYLRDPNEAVKLIQDVSVWTPFNMDTDALVRKAMANTAQHGNFAAFSSLTRRLAHSIVLTMIREIKEAEQEGDY